MTNVNVPVYQGSNLKNKSINSTYAKSQTYADLAEAAEKEIYQMKVASIQFYLGAIPATLLMMNGAPFTTALGLIIGYTALGISPSQNYIFENRPIVKTVAKVAKHRSEQLRQEADQLKYGCEIVDAKFYELDS